METIEHNSDKLTLSTQSKKPKESWLIEQLGLIAVRLGETVTAERLALYVDDLADLSLEQLERALWRARRELNFFPKIAEIRERAGADPEECQDAEAHRAWGVVVLYSDKWVHADPQGCYVPQQGCRSGQPPQLDQRTLDCVRLLGGWKRLKTASEDDVPFLKKDFIEEYKRWDAVARIDIAHLIEAVPEVKRLVAKPINLPTPAAPQEQRQRSKIKPVDEPLTPVQIRDRREMLRQQAIVAAARFRKMGDGVPETQSSVANPSCCD